MIYPVDNFSHCFEQPGPDVPSGVTGKYIIHIRPMMKCKSVFYSLFIYMHYHWRASCQEGVICSRHNIAEILLKLELNTNQSGRVGIPSLDLDQDLFPPSYVSWSYFVFSESRWEVIVWGFFIGGIVDYHCLNILFINIEI